MTFVLSNPRAVIKVLRDVEPEMENIEYMAASLEAYMEGNEGKLKEWRTVLTDMLEDNQWQGDVDEVLEQLKRRCLTYKPPDPLYPGAPVLAVLSEDGAWHEALLDSIDDDGYHVIFTQYGKPQTCKKEDICAIDDVADEGDDDLGEGECALCQRMLPMTFHHLIPRETHKKWLKKNKLPGNIVDGECSVNFLSSYGIEICRGCHSFIHSSETNKTLAEEVNTKELILAHPRMSNWIAYASKQKALVRSRR